MISKKFEINRALHTIFKYFKFNSIVFCNFVFVHFSKKLHYHKKISDKTKKDL
jgi:hypothetical protein